MKKTIFAGVLTALVFTTACSASHRFMVQAERTLTAGSEYWDQKTDQVIETCRAADLPSAAERSKCVEDYKHIDESIVAPAMYAAVSAMRAYWLGVAVGEDPKDLAAHIANFVDAVNDLPVEHFGGLRKLKP